VRPLPEDGPIPQQNDTFLLGSFPSNKASLTANSTENAARTLWHFAQHFFTEFPDYKPNDNRISIWTESYGGKYGPSMAAFFQEQNQKILNGSLTDMAHSFVIHLDTLGIINGCVDTLSAELSYPMMAYNNTYDLKTISEDLFNSAVANWSAPGGCRDQVLECRSLAAQFDPNNQGGNSQVNDACAMADETCL